MNFVTDQLNTFSYLFTISCISTVAAGTNEEMAPFTRIHPLPVMWLCVMHQNHSSFSTTRSQRAFHGFPCLLHMTNFNPLTTHNNILHTIKTVPISSHYGGKLSWDKWDGTQVKNIRIATWICMQKYKEETIVLEENSTKDNLL